MSKEADARALRNWRYCYLNQFGLISHTQHKGFRGENFSTEMGKVVCVTGASGYIASWLVKLLLQRGYTVKGTVRNLSKNSLSLSLSLRDTHSTVLLYSFVDDAPGELHRLCT